MSYHFMENTKHRLGYEEERELLIKAKNNDVEARNQLISSVFCYAKELAWMYCKKWGMINMFEDFLQEALLAVNGAIDKFDLNYNNKFITFVYYQIFSKLSEVKERFKSFTRTPRNRCTELNVLRRVQVELEQKLFREPTLQELSEASNYSLQKINKLLDTDKNALSLSTTSSNDNSEDDKNEEFTIFCDYIDLMKTDPFLEYEKSEMKNYVHKLIAESGLTENEITVIYWRFGFGGEILTRKKIAVRFLNTSEERVRQLEKRALFKMGCNLLAQECVIYMDNPSKALQKSIEYRKEYLSKRYRWGK